MPKLFYMQFVVSDWRRDVAGCSLAAIGAWIQLCTSMFEANQTGIVAGSIRELASKCGAQVDEFRPALAELQRKVIGDISPLIDECDDATVVTVVNRRMKRKHEQRAKEGDSRKSKDLEKEPEKNRETNGEETEEKRDENGPEKTHSNSKSKSSVSGSGSEGRGAGEGWGLASLEDGWREVTKTSPSGDTPMLRDLVDRVEQSAAMVGVSAASRWRAVLTAFGRYQAARAAIGKGGPMTRMQKVSEIFSALEQIADGADPVVFVGQPERHSAAAPQLPEKKPAYHQPVKRGYRD